MTDQRKPGRPPGSTSTHPTRDVIKQIRWTAKEWERIEAAAEKENKTVADAQRDALGKWAERVLR